MNARRLLSATFLAVAAVFAPGTAGAVDIKTFKAPQGAPPGSDVWFVEDHTLPMIAMSAAFPAGSAYDPSGKGGLASLAASLLDEGAGRYNSSAFQVALSDRAIRLSASVDRDHMVVTLITLSENAKQAFALLGTALSKPRFELSTMARVRGQIVAALSQDEEDPGNVAAKSFFKIFFRGHPYANPVNGTPQTLGTIAPPDLHAFARSHWVRGGLKIAVSGDVNAETLKSLLKTAFGALPPSPPPSFPPVGGVGAPGVHVIPMPVPQPNVIFGETGLLRADKDFLAGYVANYIIGGGSSARLTTEVREKRGLTYGVSTSLVPYRRAGVVLGQVATKRESVRQAVDVIRDTMRQFAEEGPTPKELADAKTYLTGSFPLAFDSNGGIAAQLNAFQRAGLSVDYVDKRNDLIAAVTAEDVARVARRLYNPSKLTIVVAGGIGAPAKNPRAPAKKPAAKPAPKPVKR